MMHGTYNPWLVTASVLIAMLASFTALDMAWRVSEAQRRSARWWLIGGSIAMGTGIWSMHFVGMLAFQLPVPMGYDPAITFLSLLFAIGLSAFALWRVCFGQMTFIRLSCGALIMGSGVTAMHYTGMAAMRMSPPIQYDPLLFTLSVLIAVTASGAALWIAFHLRRQTANIRRMRAGAAVIMGFAIAGMHYTGMAAAHFPMNCASQTVQPGLYATWMAPTLIIFTLAVLAIALIISILDYRLETGTAKLAASLADANQELQFLALHDSLTKLPNRLQLESRIEEEMKRARRRGSRFALMFMDLDGFKQINDAYGHHVGDELLIAVAERLRPLIGERDTIARHGGDEFVLIADVSTAACAARLAKNLLDAMRLPVVIDSYTCSVPISVGIAFYIPGVTLAELLRNADVAMYHAKLSGRNCYRFFEASMNENLQSQLEIQHDLRQALENRELVLYYQPKFNAQANVIIGVEALMRWNHPRLGLIAPQEFIPLAEKSGLIVSIGDWTIHEACRQMSEWRKSGFSNWTVAVNLSAHQFNHPSLVETLSRNMTQYGIEPARLILEITESTAMYNPETSIAILEKIRELGVQIAIDDFGTGYSSLLYLKRLPANELKIDRGFVRDLTHGSEDAAIISAIVALGQTLNLHVVAEGVETPMQQDFLASLGCDSLQGYLLGRPMLPEQLLKVITSRQEIEKDPAA